MLLFKKFYLNNQPLLKIINESTRGINILDFDFTNNINRVSNVHIHDSFFSFNHSAIHLF